MYIVDRKAFAIYSSAYPNTHNMMRPYLFVLASALLSSCAGTSYKAKSGTPQTLTVGVKQFTSKNYASLPANEKGVRDYEHLALPAMLVKALNKTPGVTKAYFVPANSPGVDVTVDGAITQSNGRDLSLALTISRMDGKVLAKKNLAISHAAKDVSGIRATNQGLFNQAATTVAATRQKYAYDPEDLRALVYAEAKTPSTPELVRMGKEAAQVERTQVYSPLTNALTPRIDATSQVYHQWQKDSVPFIAQKAQAEAEKASAEAAETLGMLMSFAGGMAGGMSAATGNSYGMLSAMPLMTTGAEISAQGSADAAVAQNKINELSAALAKISGQFNIGAAREMTVRIYNKVITLKGTKEQMTAEFRKIVKEEMAKELAKAQAVPAPAAA
jgi:hypothetical protein